MTRSTVIKACLLVSMHPVCSRLENMSCSVSSCQELLEALTDPEVGVVRLEGGVILDPVVYNQIIGPKQTVRLDRNVTILGYRDVQGEAEGGSVLSFSNIPAAITVATNRQLLFRDVVVRGVSSRYNPDMAQRVHLVNAGLGVWPAVVLEPQATVFFQDTEYEFIGTNCSYHNIQRRVDGINNFLGSNSSAEVTPTGVLHSKGDLLVAMPVRAYQPQAGSLQNMTLLGQFYLHTLRTYQQCLEDPLAPPGAAYNYWYAGETGVQVIHAIPPSQPSSGSPAASSGPTVSPYVWLGVALGAFGVLALMTAGTLMTRRFMRGRWRGVRVEGPRPRGPCDAMLMMRDDTAAVWKALEPHTVRPRGVPLYV